MTKRGEVEEDGGEDGGDTGEEVGEGEARRSTASRHLSRGLPLRLITGLFVGLLVWFLPVLVEIFPVRTNDKLSRHRCLRRENDEAEVAELGKESFKVRSLHGVREVYCFPLLLQLRKRLVSMIFLLLLLDGILGEGLRNCWDAESFPRPLSARLLFFLLLWVRG